MDPAAAAAMSDPERNPHFRRRWHDQPVAAVPSRQADGQSGLGTVGLALLEALRAKRLVGTKSGEQDIFQHSNVAP